MKINKLAAALIAAMTVIAPVSLDVPAFAPTTVFAEDTDSIAALQDWIPTDFESALAFRNTYGTVHIADGLLCLVVNESRECERKGNIKGEPHYDINTFGDVMELVKDDTYGTENSSSDYEVVVYKPNGIGDFEVAIADNWVKSPSLEPQLGYIHYIGYYTFSVDDEKNITETDRFGWIPDSVTEYNDYLDKHGAVSTFGKYIVFCLDSTVGSPCTWQLMLTGFSEYADLYDTSVCSKETEIPLDGGTSHIIRVFEATNDGYVTIGYEYRKDLVGESTLPPEKSLVADCVIIDNAQTVLLPGDTKVELIDEKNGELIGYQHDSHTEFGCVLFRECELGGDLFENPAVTYLPSNPCIVKYRDLSKEREYSFHIGIVSKALKGYSALPDETSVVRYDNNSYKLVFKLKKSANGDVNNDGEFGIADLVSFKSWLLGVPDSELADWEAADLCSDGSLDSFDFCQMRKLLVEHSPQAE